MSNTCTPPVTDGCTSLQLLGKDVERHEGEIVELKGNQTTLFSKLDSLTEAINNRFQDIYKSALLLLLSSFVFPIMLGLVWYLLNHVGVPNATH